MSESWMFVPLDVIRNVVIDVLERKGFSPNYDIPGMEIASVDGHIATVYIWNKIHSSLKIVEIDLNKRCVVP